MGNPAVTRGEQCTAKSKRSGQRCQHLVIGGGPCHLHGGNAPQVKRKRLQRVALAEALARDPRRSPAEVLADVGHQADYLMRLARESVKAGAPTTELVEVVARSETAARWAKTALDAEVDQRQTRVLEVQTAVIVGVFERALGRLSLPAAQLDAAREALADELERAAIEGETV